MKGATSRQLELLRAIACFSQEHRYPPTLRELAPLIGRQLRAVYDRLLGLRAKGLVEVTEQRSRGLRITAAGWALLGESPGLSRSGATHVLVKPRRCQWCASLTFTQHRPEFCRELQALAEGEVAS